MIQAGYILLLCITKMTNKVSKTQGSAYDFHTTVAIVGAVRSAFLPVASCTLPASKRSSLDSLYKIRGYGIYYFENSPF
jgi:hypothetical protein